MNCLFVVTVYDHNVNVADGKHWTRDLKVFPWELRVIFIGRQRLRNLNGVVDSGFALNRSGRFVFIPGSF